jgi:hypothetical protein
MTVKQSDADQLQKQKNAKMAMLRYQASKSIDAQGDKMTMPGLALGGLTGAAIGSVRDYYGRSRVLPLAAVGGAVGMLGLRMAGRMDERNRLNNLAKDMKKTNLQALKPALRELAARSEQLKEFAMVRDASGRYVEVEEDGFPVGAAVKAGAGAAALGGAGYGAYRGHQAIMGKFGTFGPMEAGKNRYVEAYKGAGAAGFGAVKAGGQAGWDSLKNAGQGAMNSSQAAVQSGVNSAKTAAQSGLNTAKKSGFGRRLRAGLLGAARWMK